MRASIRPKNFQATEVGGGGDTGSKDSKEMPEKKEGFAEEEEAGKCPCLAPSSKLGAPLCRPNTAWKVKISRDQVARQDKGRQGFLLP